MLIFFRRLLVGLPLFFTLAAFTRADGPLTTEIRTLAADIKKLLDGREETSIAIGQFVGPPRLPSSAGPAFAHLLAEELRRLKIDVRKKAKLTVEGRYRLVEDAVSKLAAVELLVKFVNEDGDEIGGLKLKPRGIFGDSAVAGILGLTVQLPPDGSDKVRDKKIREAYEKPPPPKLDAGKTIIRSSAASPYGIEVQVKKDGKYVPRAVKDDEGSAFVKIDRKEVYAVRIINDADHEVAVTLTIDGLNMFTFSKLRNKEGKPLYSCFLVGKKSQTLVTGWHVDNKESDEFLVTEYAKSAAGQLGSSANLGTITATFAAAWPKDGKPPADEPTAPSQRSKSADATGRGARHEKKWTEVERLFGVTRDAVSVRYTK